MREISTSPEGGKNNALRILLLLLVAESLLHALNLRQLLPALIIRISSSVITGAPSCLIILPESHK